MSAQDVEEWLAGQDPIKRATLEQVREAILDLVPEAEQGLSYGVPAFRVGGKLVAGLSAAKRHLSYLPHSGSVLSSMDPDELAGHEWSKGALRFPVDQPLDSELVRKLVEARLATQEPESWFQAASASSNTPKTPIPLFAPCDRALRFNV